MLAYTRLEIEAYARRHKITWREDASNKESDYARNLLRNDLFPALDTATPGWRNNLQHVLQRLETADELTRHILAVYANEQQDALPVDILQQFSVTTRLTILHRFIAGHEPEITTGLLHQAALLLNAQPGRQVRISPQLTLWRESEKLQLIKKRPGCIEPGTSPDNDYQYAGSGCTPKTGQLVARSGKGFQTPAFSCLATC